MTDSIYEAIVQEAYEFREDRACSWDDLTIKVSDEDYQSLQQEMIQPTRHTGALSGLQSPLLFRSNELEKGEIEVEKR